MTVFQDVTAADFMLALCAASIAYTAWLLVYRLWLGPLAHFPGSPWPKITFLYEFYYEWIKPGQYYRRIHELHEEYGKDHIVQLCAHQLLTNE
jgi:hypothetical protein